ncbi:hypothetical protein A2U01_0082358, partial [Trifolium medium]|nr:hypothetical protein [Trifolium medium]
SPTLKVNLFGDLEIPLGIRQSYSATPAEGRSLMRRRCSFRIFC